MNAVQIMKLQADDRATIDRMREIVEQQIQHISRLVDDLLDVSRITRGKIVLRSQAVDLASIVSLAAENAPADDRAAEPVIPRWKSRRNHSGSRPTRHGSNR